MSSQGWKKKKSRRKSSTTPESFLEQPPLVANSNVKCQICGIPVDPKRMHFHMVRFHGAARRPLAPQTPQT
jgi:hypothetical protein